MEGGKDRMRTLSFKSRKSKDFELCKLLCLCSTCQHIVRWPYLAASEAGQNSLQVSSPVSATTQGSMLLKERSEDCKLRNN